MGRLWGSVIWGGLLQAGSDTTRPCIGWRFEFSNDSNGSQWKVPESNLPLKKYHFGCGEKTDQEGKAWMWEGFFAGVPLRSGGGIGRSQCRQEALKREKQQSMVADRIRGMRAGGTSGFQVERLWKPHLLRDRQCWRTGLLFLFWGGAESSHTVRSLKTLKWEGHVCGWLYSFAVLRSLC